MSVVEVFVILKFSPPFCHLDPCLPSVEKSEKIQKVFRVYI